MEIRCRYDVATPFYGHNELGRVESAVLLPSATAAYIHSEEFPQPFGDFESGAAVVIARCYYDYGGRTCSMQGKYSINEGGLHSGRWCRIVEYVTANNQCVRFFLFHDAGQLPDEKTVFVVSVESVKTQAEMPVAGMDNFHVFVWGMQPYF